MAIDPVGGVASLSQAYASQAAQQAPPSDETRAREAQQESRAREREKDRSVDESPPPEEGKGYRVDVMV
ncbi:MAG: hypothetical protein V1918_00980 [Planctomycetota bacterium]